MGGKGEGRGRDGEGGEGSGREGVIIKMIVHTSCIRQHNNPIQRFERCRRLNLAGFLCNVF